jgi:L-ascorbate metabolism protein UlaG (beta-lactamase superfamily)
MFNQKILTIGLVVILIISLVSLIIALTSPREIERTLREVNARLTEEIEKLRLYTPPYVYTGEPVSFVIEFENGAKFYFGADTGLTAEMKVIGDFYKPDVAFIPVGNFYTMDSKAGAYAAKLINPARYVVPNHYASFPMLTPPPPNEFLAEVAKYNLRAEPILFTEGEEQEIMGVRVVWLGHGTWRFVSPEGVEIFIDPQFAYNPKYPEDWKDMTKFKGTNLVLLSHGHFDHVTIADIQMLLAQADPVIIAPFELGIWLKDYLDAPIMPINKGANIAKQQMIDMGIPAEIAERVGGIRVYLVPADHSSSGTPLGESPRY